MARRRRPAEEPPATTAAEGAQVELVARDRLGARAFLDPSAPGAARGPGAAWAETVLARAVKQAPIYIKSEADARAAASSRAALAAYRQAPASRRSA